MTAQSVAPLTEAVTVVIRMVPDRCLLPNNRIKTHYMEQHKHMSALRTAAKYSAIGIDRVPGMVEVHYTVHWPKGRRMPDLDAIPVACKPALDGLVDAGVIDGDGHDVVVYVTARQQRADFDDSKIAVTVTPVADAPGAT